MSGETEMQQVQRFSNKRAAALEQAHDEIVRLQADNTQLLKEVESLRSQLSDMGDDASRSNAAICDLRLERDIAIRDARAHIVSLNEAGKFTAQMAAELAKSKKDGAKAWDLMRQRTDERDAFQVHLHQRDTALVAAREALEEARPYHWHAVDSKSLRDKIDHALSQIQEVSNDK